MCYTDVMKTIVGNIENIIEIKKSKFLAFAYSVGSEEEVDKILDNLRAEHRSANHVTYAYVLFSPSVEKCSDDGEPSGTAGKPILENIKRKGLQNVLVVVVRYFGGIKLGAGGLVRAYSNSAKEVLELGNVRELNLHMICDIMVSLDNKYLIENDSDIVILNKDYSQIGDKLMMYNIAVRKDIMKEKSLNNICKSVIELEEKMM